MEDVADGTATEPNRKRCGAKTRSGAPCKTPAMPNGRCRMHGGSTRGGGAPQGNQNSRIHGLNATYVKIADLETYLPDPIKRMQALANIMANRAIAAHQVTIDQPDRDTEWIDQRIARAVRTSAQATRVELAAMKVRIDGDSDEEMTRDDTFLAPDEPVPEKPIL